MGSTAVAKLHLEHQNPDTATSHPKRLLLATLRCLVRLVSAASQRIKEGDEWTLSGAEGWNRQRGRATKSLIAVTIEWLYARPGSGKYSREMSRA